MSTKILIIDASTTDLLIVKNMLKDYLVLTARNGLEAMQHIKANSDIRLILLNSNMPNGESFQILKNLNSDERYKKLRIVILSNNDAPENEMNCLKLGAVDYIRKPFYRESLNATIKMHLDCLWIQRWYEEMLFGSSQMLNTILNQVPVGIAIINSNEPFTAEFNNQVVINPVFEQITGRTREELIQIGWGNITHPEDLDKNLEYLKQMQLGNINSYSMEKRYIKPDGSIVWVYMIAARLNLKNGYKYNRICIVQDITERKNTESILYESERSKSVLLNNLPGIAFRCKPDKEWTMEFVSQGSYDLTGYKAESLIGNRDISYNDLIAPECRDAVRRKWEISYAKKVPFEYEYEIITASGQRKWVMEKGQSIFDERGALEALEGIIIDISDRKRQELQNKYLIEHDPVTGLYNRRYLKNLLENDALSKANVKRAILNINLRKIELLTRAYGFHYRQELLKKISTVFSSLCTSNCQLYSTYANRFSFYFTGYHDKNDLVQLCSNIKELLTPILLSEGIGVGVGILEIEDNDAEAKRILKNVLIASEHALSDTNQIYNCSFFLIKKWSRQFYVK